mmetsp:Transcript_89950/g.290611  ORF Transcript_89950/g.290611 Transcript_89950/m.290611 type:complete len:524 (-) Transcript_89950:82-1653(-)
MVIQDDDGLGSADSGPMGGGGDNSEMFRKFVQEHFKAFLKPVAQHVEDIRTDLSDLRSLVKSINASFSERVGMNEAKLAKTMQDLASLGAEHDKESSNRANDMATMSRRLGSTEGACQAATVSVQQMEVRMDATVNGLEAMKQALENSTSNANRLQLKHWQTQSLAQKLESTLAELKDEHLALCERHTTLVRSLNQTQQGADSQRLTLGALNSKVESTDKKTAEQVDSLSNRMLVLDRAFSKVKDVQLEQSKEVMAMPAELKRLAHHVACLEDQVEGANQADEGGHHLSANRVMSDMDTAIQEIRQMAQSGGDKKFQEMVHAVVSRVKRHSEELAEVLPAVRSNVSSAAAQREQMIEMEQKLRDHDTRHNGSQDRLNRIEGELTGNSSSIHDLQVKVQNQGSELEKTQSIQMRLLKDFGDAQSTLKTHDTELKVMEHRQLQTSMRVEAAYEYLHGLGQGLQDTHRSIMAGQDGLLSPTRPQSASLKTALPSLSVPQPRTNSRLSEFAGRPSSTPLTARGKSSR